MSKSVSGVPSVDFSGLGRAALTTLIARSHPEVIAANLETNFPSTGLLFERLSIEEVTAIESTVLEVYGREQLEKLVQWKTVSFPHYRREILRLGTTVLPDLAETKLRMSAHNPPQTIHSMMRHDIFCGDLYSGDMTFDAVHRAGTCFEAGKAYLEFGCSSAPLLRNMYATCPSAHWYGCDPVPDSINWAKEQFPFLELMCSPQWPQLDYADKFFPVPLRFRFGRISLSVPLLHGSMNYIGLSPRAGFSCSPLTATAACITT